MDLSELDPLLEDTAHLLERLVAAKSDDPGLLGTIDALRVSIEHKARPQLVEHIRERFQCLLGSLGLIPSDNEGEECD